MGGMWGRLGWRWCTHNALSLSLAFLEGMLVLKLGSHADGCDVLYLDVDCFYCDERESRGGM